MELYSCESVDTDRGSCYTSVCGMHAGDLLEDVITHLPATSPYPSLGLANSCCPSMLNRLVDRSRSN